jgi:hypothetical protein
MSPRLTACLLGLGSWIATSGLAQGQDVIYRCGNEYTNSPSAAQMSRCRVVDGANVTVVRSQPSAGGAPAVPTVSVPAPRTSPSPGAAPRVESAEQRARDADARAILEAELRKSETRLADLNREYNNGEPEKQGSESRNHQKYLDRVAEIKASISRTEADIAGIRRELARFGGAGSASK